jgi:PLP dependent protein
LGIFAQNIKSKNMSVTTSIQEITKSLPSTVQLIAVSKTHPVELISQAYAAGQRHFGENKVQELMSKVTQLPNDVFWHMIGHVQTNKVKYIAPYIGMIHGVDSLKLLQTINKEATKNDRTIDCLLQIHIAKESTKFGFDNDELIALLDDINLSDYSNVRVRGLMGMATFTDDLDQVRSEFKGLKTFYNHVKEKYFFNCASFSELSMGMSDDYHIAIEEGSTLIRVGTAIFGSR